MSKILEQAQQFVEMGIAVIPISFRDKRPDFRLVATWEPFKTQLPSLDTLRAWFGSGLHNYGVISGWNNLVVLDFDDASEYSRWLFWAREHPTASLVSQRAYRVRTARGVHVYVRIPHVERTRKIGKIDIKAAGGYVLGPGSIHPSGTEYEALTTTWHFPWVEALSDILPAELLLQDASAGPVKAAPAQCVSVDLWERAEHPFTFTEDLVNKLRKRFRIQDFFPNAQPSSADKRWLIDKCPFHDDAHPSFWIDTVHQICGCFSGCTPKPLDVINVYAWLFSLSNRDAIKALSSQY